MIDFVGGDSLSNLRCLALVMVEGNRKDLLYLCNLHMKHIRNNLVYPVLMTALLVGQILTSLDRPVSQYSCTVSFLIFLIEYVC